MSDVYLSIIIPIYNEEDCLKALWERLEPVLKAQKKPYEVLFVNDGSTDNSYALLRAVYEKSPNDVRVIDFNKNYGQHMAIMAAFEHVRGEVIVTLDADLQNPPEEIPNLVRKIEEGYDVVGGYRQEREDDWFRRWASRLNNFLRRHATDVVMKDQGCMLRAYKRSIVNIIVSCGERSTFVPILAYKLASNPCEIPVEHHARSSGKSKYNLYRLMRLNFDLFTGFSIMPLQLFTLFGFFVSSCSGLLVIYLLLRRFIIGPEAEGMFTLLAIALFLMSVAITGIGLIGEYLGRMYQAIQQRPRYLIREFLGKK